MVRKVHATTQQQHNNNTTATQQQHNSNTTTTQHNNKTTTLTRQTHCSGGLPPPRVRQGSGRHLHGCAANPTKEEKNEKEVGAAGACTKWPLRSPNATMGWVMALNRGDNSTRRPRKFGAGEGKKARNFGLPTRRAPQSSDPSPLDPKPSPPSSPGDPLETFRRPSGRPPETDVPRRTLAILVCCVLLLCEQGASRIDRISCALSLECS